ncbi:unnamed protein product [Orchesella dallaii]|uniref:Uncharacterized protein n=1 Tax=Orchesella dallaii TaxID=48710 RepID=A0ABP1QK54_9HEXA
MEKEEVCFDECMLRTGYDLLMFSRVKGALLYGANSDRGLEHLETKVLNLTEHALSTHEQHEHAVFKKQLERCLELKASFFLPHEVREIYEKNPEKGLRKICSEMLNEGKMGHIRDYVNELFQGANQECLDRTYFYLQTDEINYQTD